MSKEKEVYIQIEVIQDLIDQAIDAVAIQEENVTEQSSRELGEIVPDMKKLGEASEELEEAYLDFIEDDKKHVKQHSKAINASVRKIFTSIMNIKTTAENWVSEEPDPEVEHPFVETNDPDADIGKPGPIQKAYNVLVKKLEEHWAHQLIINIRKLGDQALKVSRQLKRLFVLGDPDVAIPSGRARRVNNLLLGKGRGNGWASGV